MPKSPCFKPISLRPAIGPLDVRSQPDQIPFGTYRWLENIAIDKKRRPCRLNGLSRAFPDRDENNWDLHDQLDQYTRQPLTFLYQAITPTGFAKFFAGTQNRIYSLNTDSGNWRIITDAYGGTAQAGCAERRFKGATVNSTTVFSNGYDPLFAHVIDQPEEDGGQYVTSIQDLELLYISKAKVIVAWNNIVFLMNIEQEGEWHANRILWGDYGRPLSYVPLDQSLAGYQDIDSHDRILGAMPIKDSLLVYTTNGIWEGRVVGGDQGVAFNRRWQSEKGKRTLAYPNTLVSDGERHWYLGDDNIYRYSMFDQEPTILDWTDRIAPMLLDDIRKDKCAIHVGGYEGNYDRIWWSVAREDEDCPSHSMIMYPDHEFASHVDYGFSAFLYVEPDVNSTLRSFILEKCICSLTELSTYGAGFSNEGGFCNAESEENCPTPPASFFSNNPLTEGDVVTEDWTGSPDSDSLYNQLADIKINDICGDEFQADECNSQKLFMMASSEDYCIKQSYDIRHREKCTIFTGCGTYENVGYKSRIVSPPLDMNLPDDDKIVNRFAIESHFEAESIPAQILLRIGMSATAQDPMDEHCAVIWEDEDEKTIGCQDKTSAAEHSKDGTRPADPMEWGLYMIGRYFYFDISVVNDDSDPVDMGGIVCFSRFTFDAAAQPRS